MSATPAAHEDEGNDFERPAKRRRYDTHMPYRDSLYSQILLEELNLEIALRERLTKTIGSRMTWALMLQDELLSRQPQGLAGGENFPDTALDALDAIEEPSIILYDRESRQSSVPFDLALRPTSPPAETVPTSEPQPRPSSLRIRGLPRAPPPLTRKLLFLRNYTSHPPEIVKLACPDCARSDFTNLQGLLNHCRIRHRREYGSHDECIQRCAVLVPENERDWIVANGTELGGISLPSLRGLFEIAVGQENAGIIFSSKTEATGTPDIPDVVTETSQESKDITSTHVTRTLGHHADSPALAAFLGRTPQQREIHVYDEEVDIEGLQQMPGVQGFSFWRKPHAHRNAAREELDALPTAATQSQDEPVRSPDFEHHAPRSRAVGEGSPAPQSTILVSRFYVHARVKILDESLWLPPEFRLEGLPQHTHKWRLSISAPAYSLHITSILSHFTVTCSSDPPPLTLRKPLFVTGPPFVVTSTSDRPFLAKIILTWVGNRNTPTEIEHWVELDPMKVDHVVKGEEQLFDVDLDKDTEFLPPREVFGLVSWNVHRNRSSTKAQNSTDAGQRPDEPDHITKLRSLLPLVPKTLRDLKGRAAPTIPYMLPASLSALRSMALGRRKAIELRRTRVLREFYEDFRISHPGLLYPELTTSDIYSWMTDEGLFWRPLTRKELPDLSHSSVPKNDRNTSPPPRIPEAYCRSCGIHESLHLQDHVVKTEESSNRSLEKLEDRLSLAGACSGSLAHQIPVCDPYRLLAARQSDSNEYGMSSALFTTLDRLSSQASTRSWRFPASLPLNSADPQLTLAICSFISPWRYKISCDGADGLATAPKKDIAVHALLRRPRHEVEGMMAPPALLALLTRTFAKLLLRAGLEEYNDDGRSLLDSGQGEQTRSNGNTPPSCLLVPAHVLRGLKRRAQWSTVDAAAMLTLSQLGRTSVSTSATCLVNAHPRMSGGPTSTFLEYDSDEANMQVDG